MTLGGRRIAVERPRVRSADGREEVRLQTYEHFADRDPLERVVMERKLASVSTRRYARTAEPVGSAVEAKRAVKALRKAIRNVFGEAPVQRCLRHYADLLVMPTTRFAADLSLLRRAPSWETLGIIGVGTMRRLRAISTGKSEQESRMRRPCRVLVRILERDCPRERR